MKTGIISAYFGERGYGFIKDSDAQQFKHWFFHVHNCRVEPQIGLRVQFNIGEGRKGPMAIDVNAVTTVNTVGTRDASAEVGRG